MADDGTMQQIYFRITQKIQSSQKQIGQIEAQIASSDRESRLASLTRREIEGLDASTPMYKSVGKMFVQAPKDALMDELDESIESAKTLTDALEKKQKFVKRELDEATSNLRDVIQSMKASAAAAS
ncbi:hypothetical protein GGI15_004295 [Coemansia interrupta]|uniref:Prefoldin subunit 1 n=1 Tax=Coemansia interrupta TaxID=1126814 RepID=A0A9W8LEA2_9FUNG|nr:hypothetical protein GGI15_004295 [Coemansia interrupta]